MLLTLALLAVESWGKLQGPFDRYYHRDFKGALAQLDARSQDADTRFLLARIYYENGDVKRATEMLSKLTDDFPRKSEYWDWLGKAYGRRAEHANPFSAAGLAGKARAAFERAVELDGKNRDALSDLFEYYKEAPGIMGGGVDKAATIAERTATIDPAGSLTEKAQLARKRHDDKQAETLLRQAVTRDPKSFGASIELAKLLSESGRDAESDAVMQQAMEAHPNQPELMLARAKILVKRKRQLTEAKDLVDRVQKMPLTVDDPSPEEIQDVRKQIQQLTS